MQNSIGLAMWDSAHGSVSETEYGTSALLEIGPVANKTQNPVQIPAVRLAVTSATVIPTVL